MPRKPRRTDEQRERDYKALDMHRRGFTYRQIAAQLGWTNPRSAFDAVRRGLRDIAQVNADDIRGLMRERFDDYRQQAWRVLATKHYVVSTSGKLVYHPETGQPLVDDGPILSAVATLLRIDAEERKMLGVDAPARSRVEVITADAVESAIRQLEAELASNDDAGGGTGGPLALPPGASAGEAAAGS